VLSKRSKYGLKAVLYLAAHAGRGPVAISEVAAAEQIPHKFLEAILLDLKRQGLLHSRKGQRGGYLLARQPAEITVGQVIRGLDGPLALVPCVSQTAYARCEECVDEATCGVRLAMKQVRDATAAILDETSLTALLAQSEKSRKRKKR
jgi:Rrf2 family protein